MKGIIVNILIWSIFIIAVVIVNILNGEPISRDVAFWGSIIIANLWYSKLFDKKEE